jgi:hypothetical protein
MKTGPLGRFKSRASAFPLLFVSALEHFLKTPIRTLAQIEFIEASIVDLKDTSLEPGYSAFLIGVSMALLCREYP